MLLDLLLTNRDRLGEVVKFGGSLNCSDREMVEFRILHGGSRAISRIRRSLTYGIPPSRSLKRLKLTLLKSKFLIPEPSFLDLLFHV